MSANAKSADTRREEPRGWKGSLEVMSLKPEVPANVSVSGQLQERSAGNGEFQILVGFRLERTLNIANCAYYHVATKDKEQAQLPQR